MTGVKSDAGAANFRTLGALLAPSLARPPQREGSKPATLSDIPQKGDLGRNMFWKLPWLGCRPEPVRYVE